MKRILIFFLLGVLCIHSLYAQVESRGTDFLISFANNNNDLASAVNLQIRIAAGDAASGTITFKEDGSVVNFNIPANSVFTYPLTTAQKTASYNYVTGTSSKSILVHSDVPVSVTAFNQVLALADATNILPIPALGNEYYHLGRAGSGGTTNQDQYMIIAAENNTAIYENGTPVANLSAGQVYFKRGGNTDFSGYHITSNNPVAYYSVHSYHTINGGGDNIFQQLTPVNTWGKNFLVPVSIREVELIRVIASQDGTVITHTGAKQTNTPYTPIPASITLNAGQWVEWRVELAQNGCFIQADKPIQVCSYMVGVNYNQGAIKNGDEGFTCIPPFEQSVNTSLIAPFAGGNLNTHYALIVTPTATKNNTTISKGGNLPLPLSGGTWYDNTASGMSFYNVGLENNANTSYTIDNQNGIVVYGYGFGSNISYYYMAGSAMRNLEASFYINDIHNEDADGRTFCGDTYTLRAELNLTLHPAAGHIRWFIDGVEDISALDLMTWTKSPLSFGTPHEIKMIAKDINNVLYTITSTITASSCMDEVIICKGQIPTLTASLETAGSVTNPVYTWYSVPTGGSPIGGLPTFTPSVPILSDTVFYVSLAGENYCEGDRLAIYVIVEDCSDLVDDYSTTFVGKNDTIPVLDNDTYPAFCEPGVVPVITAGPFVSGASANVDGRNIVYIPAPDFTGRDSIIYTIACAGVTDSATVYINIVQYPDNIIDADCYIDPISDNFGIRQLPIPVINNVHTYFIPIIGDIDDDGVAEILIGKEFAGYRAKDILVVDGITGAVKETVITPSYESSTNHAIYKVDGETYLIIPAASDYSVVTDRSFLFAYKYDKVQQQFKFAWKSNIQFRNLFSPTYPAIADLDADGTPEIIIGQYIFNAKTGVALAEFPAGSTSTVGNAIGIGDILGIGEQQLVIANNLYSVAFVNKNAFNANAFTLRATAPSTPLTLDRHIAVADFNMDGHLDVLYVGQKALGVTTSTTIVYAIWDVHNNRFLGGNAFETPTITAAGGYTVSSSLPLIGDVNGDGMLDFVFMTYNRLYCYTYNPTTDLIELYWTYSVNDRSGATGITLFDFNQDKKAELVYRDEQQLWILDGSEKNNCKMITRFTGICSGTGFEYPVVADINNDGSAEIITIGSSNVTSTNGRLYILGPLQNKKWSPARKVWNQYAYNVVNVNSDLTIPRVPFNPATAFAGPDSIMGTADDVYPFNNYLQQQTILNKYGMPTWPAPDVAVDIQASSITVSGDDIIINACFDNIGSAPVGPPVYVTVYKNSISPANQIAMDSIIMKIEEGDSGCVPVTIKNAKGIGDLSNIIVRLNDRNHIFTYQPECEDDNNVLFFINPFLMKKTARLLPNLAIDNGTYPNPVSILGNEIIEYTITAYNPTATALTVTIIDTLPAYLTFNGTASSGFTQLANTTPPPSPAREVLQWSSVNVPANNSASVTFEATPQPGSVASQPLFINHAWVTVPVGAGSMKVLTNSTYHQGAGISLMTFSASLGGSIYNAGEQALDYMSTPRSGVIVAPDEGYRFAGWSHGNYTSLRGATIEAQEGIMMYDTLTVYGNVELHASFVPVEESLEDDEEIVVKSLETDDKAWAVDDELFVRTNKPNSIVRIYSLDGVLRGQHTIIVPGITTKKLSRGIYVVTINSGLGVKILIE